MFYAFVDLEKAFDRVPREVVRWALRKTGVEEWLVCAVMTMYDEARTVVRTTEGNSDSFPVNVGVHQGSVLSPLLFVLVMQAITSETKQGLPWELLYADDLVLMADNEADLKERIIIWKSALEAKGLKMNVGKTKVMSSDVKGSPAVSGKCPYSVCNKGVGSNSIQCTKCLKWVHGRCSGIKGRLPIANTGFECKTCLGVCSNQTRGVSTGLDLGQGLVLERVDKFCYLGDMIDAGGGCDSAVTTRIRCACKKFHELAPVLAVKQVTLSVKGHVYMTCILYKKLHDLR
jgi:hypothetical protein